ncbi:MAG: archaellin/type IV pilin N-terminal domain-containing protein [Candidatus Hodarchaeota archaeon]
MKIINRLISNKKRAISPVIAVVLLIGLAVAAAAAIFIVVLPLLQPTVSLEITDAYVLYDHTYTKNVDEGKGYGMGYVEVANVGTGEVEITDIKIYYATSFAGNWTLIENAVNLENITSTNPWVVGFSQQDVLRIRFVNPEGSDNNTLVYKIVVTPSEGRDLDTTRAENVDESEMQLSPDRPDISFTSELETIRRQLTISPSSVNDNSHVKNVTYEIFNISSALVRTKTITSQTSWPWQWNTYNYSTEGLDNGSYTMKMTVYDYAGLSDFVDGISFTIDNDYMKPNIVGVIGSSNKGGEGLAEVGESYSISVDIIDYGSADSRVYSAYIHYKTNSSSDITYITALMTKITGNSWIGNIPGPYIDSKALTHNLTYYISAMDYDSNTNASNDYFADVNDSTEPNFVEHMFEGESVISTIDPLSGDETQTLSLSVTVEDKDFVSEVTLVWRHRNDTTILTPDPWRSTYNISGTGETWEFRIPAINVTLDGLEYYFYAIDNNSNVAYEGEPDSPYRIIVADMVSPVITLVDGIPSEITGGSDLSVTVTVADNDPTFSWEGNERGTVELGYRRLGLDSDYNYVAMDHISGDSSQGATAIWEGTIKGGNFTTSYSPVYIRIRATDYSSQTSLLSDSVDVIASGIPSLRYTADSVSVSGSSNQILSFNIENIAGGTSPATAIINGFEIELKDNTKDPYIGEPLLIQVNATGGTNPLWENNSNPSEGANGQKITLDNSYNLIKSASTTFFLVYANTTGGYFNVNDLTVNVTVYYEYSGPTYDYEILDLFDTPITTFQDYTETRYMRSDIQTINGLSAYNFGTTQTSSPLENNQQTNRWSGSFTVTWGIRVWIRHEDTTETEITLGTWVALVQRSSDGSGIQSNSWSCPQTALVPTDAVVVRVYMQIGTTTYSPTEFITEQLGASQLNSAAWTIFYYTERDYRGWPQDRTRGIFSWGDSIYESRITNFQYRALGGGGGASMIASSFSTYSESINPTVKNSYSTKISIPKWVSPLSKLFKELNIDLVNIPPKKFCIQQSIQFKIFN